MGAEPGENAGEFHRDIAAADHRESSREFRQVENLVRADRMFDARNGGQHLRGGAGGDQNMPRRDHAAGLHQPRLVRAENFSALLENIDAGFQEIGLVDARQAGDFAFLGGDELWPVEFRLVREAPAEGLGVGEIVGEARGVDIKLFRHAAADHAGPADAEFLGDHDFRAVTRRDACGAHPSRAGADDEEIGLEFAHRRAPDQVSFPAGRRRERPPCRRRSPRWPCR